MPELSAPFIVETSFRLPGLGLLVIPASPIPAWLATYDLHTALSITILPDAQLSKTIVGTVEELTQTGQPKQRALLLDFDPDTSLAPGTCLQASELYSDLL
jgi:hypothetical protein